MKAKDNNKLPKVQGKGLKAKMRKAIFILLSSIRIMTPSTDATANNKEIVKEQEYTTNMPKDKRDSFAKSLKTIVSNENISERINENIIDDVIEKRR